MRIGCSKLKHDLFFNLKVVDSSACQCGCSDENAFHFFIDCELYIELRLDLFNAIAAYTTVNIETILNGNSSLTLAQNHAIFDAVHNFITNSKRFDV